MKFSSLVSQTPLFYSVCFAGCSPSACLLNACETQGSIASCKRHLWLQSLCHLKDHKQKWRELSQRQTEQCHMDSANRKQVSSLEAPEATNQKVFMFLPFAQLFSLSRLFSITWQDEAAPNSKFCMLSPETVSQAKVPGEGNLIHLGSSDCPGPIGQGWERCRAELGMDTQHNHSLTHVNKGHSARRKVKHTALRRGQKGPCKRQEG